MDQTLDHARKISCNFCIPLKGSTALGCFRPLRACPTFPEPAFFLRLAYTLHPGLKMCNERSMQLGKSSFNFKLKSQEFFLNMILGMGE